MHPHVQPAVKPVILISLANTTRSRGNTHVFVCAAAADPQPVFVFRFNGERITSNSSKHTTITNSTHGTLTVFDLQGSDEGTYNCSISNRFGGVSTTAVLSVQGVFERLHLYPGCYIHLHWFSQFYMYTYIIVYIYCTILFVIVQLI